MVWIVRAIARFSRKAWRWIAALVLLATLLAWAFWPSQPYIYSSRYLTMRDGVKIAVDLYLPKDLSGARIPTILRQTRYYRSFNLRWPVNVFYTAPTRGVARFVRNGYAFVAIDVRGSGASFGHRDQEWSPDEVRDGAEVVDWIIRQPWSNGRVGATGVSYEGTSSELLLVNQHPAVKAVAPRFNAFDLYGEMIMPGGIYQNLNDTWGPYVYALDNNTFGRQFLSFWPRLVFKGVNPVPEDRDGVLLQAAIREHGRNVNVLEDLQFLIYRDDFDPRTGVFADSSSPFTFVQKIQASGTPIYSYSGWYDAAGALAAIKRFQTVRTPGSRLILGPWIHGGNANQSPFSAKHELFDQTGELLRFFDFYLKDKSTGIERQKPVRYFTMGEEKWKSADTWPPPHTHAVSWYCAGGNVLSPDAPREAESFDTYQVDYTAGTGNHTRWNSLVLIDATNIDYSSRTEQDRKLLVYTTPALGRDVEITGSPEIRLFVGSTATDGTFFVYLEDIDSSGKATYITEGMLRALHRRISNEPRPFNAPGPYHSFKSTDAALLHSDRIAEISFDLLPISYLVRRGHSIRIAIAGADKDHFRSVPDKPPTIRLYRDKSHASGITLPVIEPGN